MDGDARRVVRRARELFALEAPAPWSGVLAYERALAEAGYVFETRLTRLHHLYARPWDGARLVLFRGTLNGWDHQTPPDGAYIYPATYDLGANAPERRVRCLVVPHENGCCCGGQRFEAYALYSDGTWFPRCERCHLAIAPDWIVEVAVDRAPFCACETPRFPARTTRHYAWCCVEVVGRVLEQLG